MEYISSKKVLEIAENMGLFEIKEKTIVHSDGHTTISKTPKVTEKGQQFFINAVLK